MFGVRIWHPDDRAVLDVEAWDAMKHAIHVMRAQANKKP